MAHVSDASQIATHEGRWKWFLGFGAFLLVLGMAGIGVTTFMQLTSAVVFGPMLLAAATIQVLVAFLAEKTRDTVFHLAASAVEAGLGFWLMAHPLERVIDLMALVAIFFLVSGAIRLGRALTTQSSYRGLTAMAGIIALLMGTCVWLRWPDSGWWFVGLCIAIDFLCRGLSWSALALAERKAVQSPVP